MNEFNIQKLFVAWFRATYPGVILFAIPNGEKREPATAKRLKESGVLAGVPDLFIADGKPGLFIEMKDARGRLSTAQKEMIPMLRDGGYPVAVCHSYEEAKSAVMEYFKRPTEAQEEAFCEKVGFLTADGVSEHDARLQAFKELY